MNTKKIRNFTFKPLTINLVGQYCSVFVDSKSGSVFLDEGDGEGRVNGAVLHADRGPRFGVRKRADAYGRPVHAVTVRCGRFALDLGETRDGAKAAQWVDAANERVASVGSEDDAPRRAARRSGAKWSGKKYVLLRTLRKVSRPDAVSRQAGDKVVVG